MVSEFFENKYAGNNAEVAIHLDGWLVEEQMHRDAPKTTQFVWTEVAKMIKSVASFCRDRCRIGMVYGPETSGMGKTKALQAIYEDMGPKLSTFVTIDKVDANPTGLLKKLLSSMHVDDKGTNKQRFDRIVEKLSGRRHIFLIDQIHNLRWSSEDKPFYYLTDLHAAIRGAGGEPCTSQLWAATTDMVAYLDRQRVRNVDESLVQIVTRIMPRVDLIETLGADGTGGDRLVTVDQIREMFAKNKLKITSGAARFLCRIANQPDSGSLRLCVDLVEYATMLAEMPEYRRQGVVAIDVDLLKEAMRKAMMSARSGKLLRHQRRAADPEGESLLTFNPAGLGGTGFDSCPPR